MCLERNKLEMSDSEFEIATSIENLLTKNPMSTDDIILKIVEFREDKMIHVIQFLHDNGQLEFTEDETNLGTLISLALKKYFQHEKYAHCLYGNT